MIDRFGSENLEKKRYSYSILIFSVGIMRRLCALGKALGCF